MKRLSFSAKVVASLIISALLLISTSETTNAQIISADPIGLPVQLVINSAQPIPSGTLPIDMDCDGSPDILLSADANFLPAFTPPLNFPFAIGDAQIYWGIPGPPSPGVLVWFSPPPPGQLEFPPLQLIGPLSQPLLGSETIMEQVLFPTQNNGGSFNPSTIPIPVPPGSPLGPYVEQGFLGVSFPISGQTHFGWIEIRLEVYSPSLGPALVSMTLIDFAYESTPNTGILAGATSASLCGGAPPANQAPAASFTSSVSCLTVDFTDTSTDPDGNGTINGWNWDFGDGSGTSTMQNPSYTYAAAGPYTVGLTVTDNSGAVNSTSSLNTMGVTAAPLNTYYADTDNDTYGDPANSIESCTQPSGYVTDNTDCNDGDININPGASEICGNQIDENCDNQVNEGCALPVSAFTYTVSCLTADFTDASTDADGTITNWSWDFGDGFNSNLEDVTHVYASFGTFTVKLTVTDNHGQTNSSSQMIMATPLNTYFADTDGDNFGDAAASLMSCTQPSGYVLNSTDCDDNNINVNPGASENCNTAYDDNCNNQVNEGCPTGPVITNRDSNGDGVPDIADPCSCGDPLNIRTVVSGGTEVSFFHEVVTVYSDPGETWEITAVTVGPIYDMTGTAINPAGLPLMMTETAPASGIYTVEFWHAPVVGFDVTATNNLAEMVSIANSCTGPCLQSNIPTVSEWGLVALLLLLGSLGLVAVLKREEIIAFVEDKKA